MVTIQRKTFNVNEPEAKFNNKGRTYRGDEEECNNISMSQRRYAITKGEHRSVHNTNKQTNKKFNINEPETVSHNKGRT